MGTRRLRGMKGWTNSLRRDTMLGQNPPTLLVQGYFRQEMKQETEFKLSTGIDCEGMEKQRRSLGALI